mmetsp:Transcript_32779/g.36695  ORF Transcript_32779/g.36695 Transcript_32779/m.36695 type:complete len:228 (-) Transcript_32779:74-757(-)
MKVTLRSILSTVLLLAFTMNEVTALHGEVNVEEACAASTFAIKPDDLINRTKEVLSPEISLGTKDGGKCLADDFEFVAAVVGPINKEEYLEALNTFQLEDSFDIEQNFFGFTVDPLQTNRVYFFSRQIAKHTGTDFMGAKADGKELILPPQTFHVDFNEQGLIKEVGFYTVDRRQGNTGGLGGAFGYFYGVGKPLPFPECQPFKGSLRFRGLMMMADIAKKVQAYFK